MWTTDDRTKYNDSPNCGLQTRTNYNDSPSYGLQTRTNYNGSPSCGLLTTATFSDIIQTGDVQGKDSLGCLVVFLYLVCKHV